MTIEDVIQSICNEQHDCRWIDTADFEKCLRRVAAEQKKIDIDGACQILREIEAFSTMALHDEEGVSQEVYEGMFRQAMEGQI